MFIPFQKRRLSFTNLFFSFFILFSFVSTLVVPAQIALAEDTPNTILDLPTPGTMLQVTDGYLPATVVGMTIHPDNALKFDFLIDIGEQDLEGEALNSEAMTLIKYFLSSLTVPEEELWVNLSPYQEDDIIPYSFGQTEMGRDLLAQDYMLKQLTASLMYPEDALGEEFWQRVQAKAKEKYGTIDIAVKTYNKVWVVPENAVVYEEGLSAYIVESRLKVMLEEDYLALSTGMKGNMESLDENNMKEANELSTEMVREILIPEIEKEVNTGKHFAKLRQIYSAMILALWYKESLQGSILNQVYVDKNKILGVDVDDKHVKDKIYNQYLEAFKVGVYDYMKVDVDPVTKEEIPAKYFSGGFTTLLPTGQTTSQMIVDVSRKAANDPGTADKVRTKLTERFPNLRSFNFTLLEQKNKPIVTSDSGTITAPVRMAVTPQSQAKITSALAETPEIGLVNARPVAEAVVAMSIEAPEMFHSSETMIEGLKPRLEAKGVKPSLASTIVEQKVWQRIETAIGASVDTNTAALHTAIQSNPQSKATITKAFTDVASIGQRDAAMLADTIVKLPARDFSSSSTLKKSLSDSGVDTSLISKVFKGDTFNRISNATIPKGVDTETASMAVAVKVADTSSLINVVSSMPLKKTTPQNITATIKSLQPADFSTSDTLRAALITANVDADDARTISKKSNVRQIMRAVQPVDPVSASLPAIMATDQKTVEANIALALSEEPNIDPAKAARYAKILVNTSPVNFGTRDSLEKSLAANKDVDKVDASALTKSKVLSKIAVAATSPVDNTFATIVPLGRSDRRKSAENITAELTDVPEIGGQANARKISSVIVNDISPTPTRSDFKTALVNKKIDNKTADIMVRDDVVNKVRRAVTSPVEYSVAAVATTAPAAAVVNRDAAMLAIDTELSRAGVKAADMPSITTAILKLNPKKVITTQGLQQAFTQSGSSAESAKIAAQPETIKRISKAVSRIAKTDDSTKTTAPLAAMINTSSDSRRNIASIVSASDPTLDQSDVKYAARQMIVMSQKEPQKFITSGQIEQGLIERDVNPAVAKELAKVDNLQKIAFATSKKADNTTASMPAMFKDRVTSQGKLASVYNQMPELDAPQAKVLAEQMIKISQISPEAFSSPSIVARKLETRLQDMNIPDAAMLSKAAVQPQALRMITQAHDRRMFTRHSIAETEEVGGIDLNSANIDLSINRDGEHMPLPVSQELMQNLDIGGFTPVINNVTPMLNVPLIYGDADVSTSDKVSNLK